jgi:hypothetical protein
MKKLVVIIFVFILAVGATGLWQLKPLLEQYFEALLEKRGLHNVEITISRIGLSGAELKEISFGDKNPLVLHNVTLNYTSADLRQGRLDEVLIDNISIKAAQQENDWQIYGLEGLKSNTSDTQPLSIFALSTDQIEQIPFRRFAVKESTIELITSFGALELPFNLQWQKYESPNLSYKGNSITFLSDDMKVSVINPQMSATLEEGVWTGDWNTEKIEANTSLPSLSAHGQIKADDKHISATGSFLSSDAVYKGDFTFNYVPENTPVMTLKSAVTIDMPLQGGRLKMPITLDWTSDKPLLASGKGGTIQWQSGKIALNAEETGVNLFQKGAEFSGEWRTDKLSVTAPVTVPLLQGGGSLALIGSAVNISGLISSRDKAWKADFGLEFGSPESADTGLRIKSAAMPWGKGRLSVQNVWIPFESTEPIKIKLQIEHVDLAELMETMTGKRITAKGSVSGYIALSIGTDGKITVQKGNLDAETPGIIAMPPEMIPADNQQINLVKEIMQDLHYDILSISADPDKNGKLSIKLTVEGKNPKVYNGRPVKLNVNLTGNLLDFFEQNLMFLTEPEKFLKGNQNYDKKK